MTKTARSAKRRAVRVPQPVVRESREQRIIGAYPAITSYTDLTRCDGVPMTVRLDVKRADAEFMGFRPRSIEGPECFLYRDGLVGRLTEEVITVCDRRMIMDHFRSNSQMWGAVRDLFRGPGPAFYSYLFVVTDIFWHRFVAENHPSRKPDPRGVICQIERSVVVRIPPKSKGGFASLLAGSEYDLYFCSETDAFRRYHPHHFARLMDGLERYAGSLIVYFRSGSIDTGDIVRHGVSCSFRKTGPLQAADVRLVNETALAGLEIRQTGVSITAFRGTVGNVIKLIGQFVGD